jgi:S-phase kinase-associated protein 1
MAEEDVHRQVTLVCSDNATFVVDISVARKFGTVVRMLSGADQGVVELSKVRGPVLAKVLEYENRGLALGGFNNDDLFGITLASRVLEYEDLLNAAAQAIADKMVGKKAEQLRAEFGIVNDWTPEQLKEVEAERDWS